MEPVIIRCVADLFPVDPAAKNHSWDVAADSTHPHKDGTPKRSSPWRMTTVSICSTHDCPHLEIKSHAGESLIAPFRNSQNSLATSNWWCHNCEFNVSSQSFLRTGTFCKSGEILRNFYCLTDGETLHLVYIITMRQAAHLRITKQELL